MILRQCVQRLTQEGGWGVGFDFLIISVNDV